MPKRKDTTSPGSDDDITMVSASEAIDLVNGSDNDGDDIDLVNVDFELFDPQAAHDFHGLRTLLRQLFDVDSALFDLSALTDLILSQPTLGSTVKTEGNTSDPYAFLTVINMNEHAEKPCVKTLREYLLARSTGNSTVHAQLKALLEGDGTKGQLGLILTERVVNMPVEVVPPMYKMLLEEVEWALEDGEPYEFTHWLVVSKTYTEVVSKLDEMESRPNKKGKKVAKRGKGEVFYYHAEDEAIRQKVGVERVLDFQFSKEGETADSKRAFSDMGVKPQGLMMLLEKGQLKDVVETLEGLFKP